MQQNHDALPFPACNPGEYRPNFRDMTRIGPIESIAAAMDRYYKPDRLNRPGGTRERLIKDREVCLQDKLWDCIASHFDALGGQAVYVVKTLSGIDIYVDTRS